MHPAKQKVENRKRKSEQKGTKTTKAKGEKRLKPHE